MTSQRPGPSFRRFAGGRSWSVIYRGSFDYVTQRPDPDGSGDLLIGGGLNRSASRAVDDIGVSNDAEVDRSVIRYLDGVFPTLFEPHPAGTSSDMAWSGIISVTLDTLPFVGRLDTRRDVPKSSPGKGLDRRNGCRRCITAKAWSLHSYAARRWRFV